MTCLRADIRIWPLTRKRLKRSLVNPSSTRPPRNGTLTGIWNRFLHEATGEAHPVHGGAVSWLSRAKTGEAVMVISSHTLAELYAVLTTLPVSPRISPDMAWRLIHENIEKTATVEPLSPKDYSETILRLKDGGFSGGIVYDALIFKAAVKSGSDSLLTLNSADFVRLKFSEALRIIEP